MANTSTSTQFNVNWYDLLHGFFVAVLTPVFTIIITSINAGKLVFDWKAIGMVALAGALGYISKNFLTPSKIIVTDASKQDVKDVKSGDAEVTLTKT
jgi:hypothetical protein